MHACIHMQKLNVSNILCIKIAFGNGSTAGRQRYMFIKWALILSETKMASYLSNSYLKLWNIVGKALY